MYLAGINLSDFDATATILEVLRSDDEADINDTNNNNNKRTKNI